MKKLFCLLPFVAVFSMHGAMPVADPESEFTRRVKEQTNAAAWRSLLDLAPPINVKAVPFSAAGDGLTDDTQALQSAIDSASTNSNMEVFIPRGVYRTRPLNITNNNIRICGAGNALGYELPTQSTKLLFTAGPPGTNGIFMAGRLGRSPRGSYIVLENLVLDGGTNVDYTVEFSGTSVLDSCTITGGKLANIRARNFSNGSRIARCLSIFSSGDGLLVEGPYTTPMTISDSLFRQNLRAGVRLNGGYMLHFLNCIIESNQRGGLWAEVTSRIGAYGQIQLQNCWFEGNGATNDYQVTITSALPGPPSYGWSLMEIKNCFFKVKPWTGVLWADHVSGLSVENCHSSGTSTNAVYIGPHAKDVEMRSAFPAIADIPAKYFVIPPRNGRYSFPKLTVFAENEHYQYGSLSNVAMMFNPQFVPGGDTTRKVSLGSIVWTNNVHGALAELMPILVQPAASYQSAFEFWINDASGHVNRTNGLSVYSDHLELGHMAQGAKIRYYPRPPEGSASDSPGGILLCTNPSLAGPGSLLYVKADGVDTPTGWLRTIGINNRNHVNAGDATIYAGRMDLDHDLYTRQRGGGQVMVGEVTPERNAGIALGASADVKLYRDPKVVALRTESPLLVNNYIRLPNGAPLYGRNARDSTNVAAIGINASDEVALAPNGQATVAGGTFRPVGGYQTTDGSVGITVTITNVVPNVATNRLTFKNGLLVGSVAL